ncbi:2,4-dienoyl-CoA reductase [Kwoniella heveanensis CBS 569]|nr:2,4-dienoyl-CoA reductase [Kwoniella heveanensis CBS 569]
MQQSPRSQQPQDIKQPVIGLAPSAASAPEAQSRIREVRKQVLNDVKRRAEVTKGSGRLEGKVGVITGVGPSVGIGTAAAKLFAREGVKHLYLVDFDDGPLPALLKFLSETYPRTKVTFRKADAASGPAISSLMHQALSEEGHLDFFFANAGISQIKPKGHQQVTEKGGQESIASEALADLKRTVRPVTQIQEEEFNEVMRINALSVFIAIKYASEAMKKTCPEQGKYVSGGSIILTASSESAKFVQPLLSSSPTLYVFPHFVSKPASQPASRLMILFYQDVFASSPSSHIVQHVHLASALTHKVTHQNANELRQTNLLPFPTPHMHPVAGLKSNAGPIPYSASKAAVVSMAQTSSYDLTGTNIRVNALCPGLIQTDMTRGLFALAEMAGKGDKMGSLNPAQRQGIGMGK